MPRGRKPIPRTKDEALQVRREQVRKNVQAYRERKKSQERQEGEEGKLDESTNDQEPIAGVRRRSSSKTGAITAEEIASERLSVSLSSSSRSRPSSATRIDGARREFKVPIRFADEVPVGESSWASTSLIGTYSTPEVNVNGTRLVPSQRRTLDFLPQGINSSALSRRQFIANSSVLFLPQTQARPEALADLGPHWAQHVQCINCQPNDFMDQTLLPVCLLQIAHLRQDRSLAETSRSYYGQALQALRSNTRSGQLLWKELTISAMALGTYEVYNGVGDQWVGWEAHLQGVSSYLQNFSSFDESLDGLLYFYYLETSCIFDAIRQRKPSPLSKTKWWEHMIDCYGGRIYGQLLRLMTPLAAYMERFDHLMGMPLAKQSCGSMSALLSDCSLQEDALKDWFEDTTEKIPNFVYDDMEESNLMPNILPLETSEIQYSFPNLWIARLHLLYWSCVIQLQLAMAELVISIARRASYESNTTPATTVQDNSAMLEDLTAQTQMFATNIRRSAAFCLDSQNGLMGKTIVIQPLWVAQRYFLHTDQDQAQWCLAVLKRIRQDDFGSPNSPTLTTTGSELAQQPAQTKPEASQQP